MVRTRDRAVHEPLSIINRRRNRFTTPPFVTIHSHESSLSLPPQPHRPRRNRRLTLITVVYLPYEPLVSADHPPNSPVEPPNSSDNQDRLSLQLNVHAHQPIQPRPSRRILRPQTMVLNHIQCKNEPEVANNHLWPVHQLHR
ncbi:hypothetical protein GOBAR_DD06089 [Gossypium barbadense]|nr:hypothetical protein GOBAR_DD06089 [Gossypium barbadense]